MPSNRVWRIRDHTRTFAFALTATADHTVTRSAAVRRMEGPDCSTEVHSCFVPTAAAGIGESRSRDRDTLYATQPDTRGETGGTVVGFRFRR